MSIQEKNPLHDLGFETGNDLAHEELVDFIEPEEYRDRAYKMLDGVHDIVGSLVERIDDFADRWNPNGFMVFPLGIHRTLGSLRLHVYPEKDSKELQGEPEIHSHAWHLSSLVLGSGDYRDHIFSLNDEPNGDSPGPHHIYKSRRDENGVDYQTSDGTEVFPEIVETRVIPPSQKHFIPAGQHHAPVHSQFPTSTLVLDSHAFLPFTEIVRPRGDATPDREVAAQRSNLTESDILQAKGILDQAIN